MCSSDLTTLDDGWNDLPYRPGYVPLISRLVTRLSKHTYAGDVPVVPGAPHRIAVPGRAARVVVTSPDGTTYDLPDNRPFTHTATPGVYRVAVETPSAALTDVGELAFVVAPDPRESDLRPARITDTGAAKAQPKTRSVIQQPAANWAFLALGILALAEGLARIARLRTRPPVTGQGAPSPATTASLR